MKGEGRGRGLDGARKGDKERMSEGLGGGQGVGMIDA